MSCYNFISLNESEYPSKFGDCTDWSAFDGQLVTLDGDLTKFYICKKQVQCFYQLPDRVQVLNLLYPSYTNITYTISSIIFNGTEYITTPLTVFFDYATETLTYNINGYVAVLTAYNGTGVGQTTSNFVDFLNTSFASLLIPLKARMAETIDETALGLDHAISEGFQLSLSDSDTFQMTVGKSGSGGQSGPGYIFYYSNNIARLSQNNGGSYNTTAAGNITSYVGYYNDICDCETTYTPTLAYFTSQSLHVEDGIVTNFDFWVDLAKEAVLNNLEFILLAYNPVLLRYFELDKFVVQIANSIISGGSQQIEINTTRGYILKSGDQFNFIKITTGSLVGTKQHYTGNYAQKISWQTWKEQIDADPVFYDNTKPLNNLNKKASNYSNLNNYDIKLAIKANLTGKNTLGQTGITDYLALTPPQPIADYDMPTDWTAEIKTYISDGSFNLSGAILVGQDTLFTVEWTRASGAVTSVSGFWAIHRIQESNSNYDIHELSSIRDYPTNNNLKPITGESFTKIEIVAGKVVTSCLIDGTKIISGVNYDLSARLQAGYSIGSVSEGIGEMIVEDTFIVE